LEGTETGGVHAEAAEAQASEFFCSDDLQAPVPVPCKENRPNRQVTAIAPDAYVLCMIVMYQRHDPFPPDTLPASGMTDV
jgi:hypothetical protein